MAYGTDGRRETGRRDGRGGHRTDGWGDDPGMVWDGSTFRVRQLGGELSRRLQERGRAPTGLDSLVAPSSAHFGAAHRSFIAFTGEWFHDVGILVLKHLFEQMSEKLGKRNKLYSAKPSLVRAFSRCVACTESGTSAGRGSFLTIVGTSLIGAVMVLLHGRIGLVTIQTLALW